MFNFSDSYAVFDILPASNSFLSIASLLIHLQQTLIHLQLISLILCEARNKSSSSLFCCIVYQLACLDAAALSAISFALSAPSF
jgi:hypothetical protein